MGSAFCSTPGRRNYRVNDSLRRQTNPGNRLLLPAMAWYAKGDSRLNEALLPAEVKDDYERDTELMADSDPKRRQ